jgi:hypothetical protein
LLQTIDWVADPDAAFHGLVQLFAAGIEQAVSDRAATA